MSLALPSRVRTAVRSATIAVVALAGTLPASTAAAQTPTGVEPVDASAPQLPWVSVSDVVAATLEAAAPAPATSPAAAAPVAPAAEPAEPAAATEPRPAPAVFATVDGIELREPSPHVELYGFHEGSTQGRSLHPVGRVIGNESAMTPPADVEGPDYRIMASRGRGVGASTAVDIALAADRPVHAMLAGTVVSVSDYSLYGSTNDVLIEIAPAGRTDRKVQVFHVREPKVAVGDVVTSDTVIAFPRQLPFGSQIDRLVGKAGPHVHVQVVGA